eukprot:Anaeramoba_flamelloidesa836867_12.p1 GENE.a836867_12~~a836867_12.p1  ORF type:complete len:218 (+),score=33.35 a836867_12:59-712(+)
MNNTPSSRSLKNEDSIWKRRMVSQVELFRQKRKREKFQVSEKILSIVFSEITYTVLTQTLIPDEFGTLLESLGWIPNLPFKPTRKFHQKKNEQSHIKIVQTFYNLISKDRFSNYVFLRGVSVSELIFFLLFDLTKLKARKTAVKIKHPQLRNVKKKHIERLIDLIFKSKFTLRYKVITSMVLRKLIPKVGYKKVKQNELVKKIEQELDRFEKKVCFH